MNKTFRIKNNRHYFYTGQLPDKQQVVIGIILPEMLAARFDLEGRLQEVVAKPLQGVFSSHDDKEAIRQLVAWQKELRLTHSPIRVQTFFDDSRFIGIKELPEHYQEVVEHPERFDPTRRRQLEDDVHEWRTRGDFVLYWGEDYYLDKHGDVVSS